MQKILLTVKQAFLSSILVFGLIIFISLSGSLIFVQQANATTLEELKLIPPEYKPNSQEKINRANEFDPGVGVLEEEREEAYDQAVKDSKNLNTLEKTYERNLKAEQEGKPQESFGEKAKEVIEKVTGK